MRRKRTQKRADEHTVRDVELWRQEDAERQRGDSSEQGND
jgi:hypothetical protein